MPIVRCGGSLDSTRGIVRADRSRQDLPVSGHSHVRRGNPKTATKTAPRAGESQLRRGLRIIESLAERPESAAGLARQLGVNRSTALRLLQELEAAGYVRRDPNTGRFSTVPARLYPLIAAHDDHSDWAELLHPLLASVRDEFGEAAVHAVPAGGSMVYVALLPSLHPVAVRERIGTVRPIHCSALGKAYLSSLDQRSLDVELGRLTYEGGTPRAAKGPLDLRERLIEVREGGYAVDSEETFDGVVCVAVPTRISEALVGSVGVSGPADRLPPQRVEEIGEWLLEKLAQIGRPVGSRGTYSDSKRRLMHEARSAGGRSVAPGSSEGQSSSSGGVDRLETLEATP